MNVLIVGCGLTGSRLANKLDERGCGVSVVDADRDAFEALSADFSGLAVCGEAIDADVLKNAGAENADVAAVVTRRDNVNVMAAQILKTEFSVPAVYVRALDPSREAVFRQFGLSTICPTRYEADVLFSLITDETEEINSVSVGGDSMQLELLKAEKRDIGKRADELVMKKNRMAVAIMKSGGYLILANDTDAVIEDGDAVVYAALWKE